MDLTARINAFASVGGFLERHYSSSRMPAEVSLHEGLEKIIAIAHTRNNWFIPQFVNTALQNIIPWLNKPSLETFASGLRPGTEKTVAVICAGNIPMAGFHDVLCVLLSGHRALLKLSSDDDTLIPFLLKLLAHYQPAFESRILFASGKLSQFDAVIATGSNNTAGYFEHYFGKYPNIIRKNRTSVAVLNGNESSEELRRLGEDVFLYFGLGCRNVSKLLVPENYSFDRFFEAIHGFGYVIDNNKYGNNYDYNRAVYLMGSHKFLDNNFLIVKEDTALHAPVAVLYYTRYRSMAEVNRFLAASGGEIQCVVGARHTPFGYSQRPVITEFADHINTLQFLVNL